MNRKRIAFHHFGCKVNFSEASDIAGQFRGEGFMVVDHREIADVYVISSCMVTSVAEKKCRAAVRQARRLNPEALIAVVGCMAELRTPELKAMEGVGLVLGNDTKFNLLREVAKQLNTYSGILPDYFSPVDSCITRLNRHLPESRPPGRAFIPTRSLGDRTRSFLKIQDGCDYHCAYCTIPMARGHSRSDTIDHVVYEISEIARQGIREIILTGINLGDFGKNNGESLHALLLAIRDYFHAPRIRLSSVEPDLLSDGIIDIVAKNELFMPHFHLPLQSGSDRILKLMKRKYNRDLFADRVGRIKQAIPLACIAVDVITGFPGENEDDFNGTFRLIEALPLSYLHVFPYSEREKTLASGFKDKVSGHVKKLRSERLHELSRIKKHEFYRQNIGNEVVVLFESDNTGGYLHGFTENYCKVRTPFRENLVNTLKRMVLPEPGPDEMFTVEKFHDES